MASAFEQRAVCRKFIYFGLILLFFTGSLLHRKLVINAQADQLLLRDVGRGKADLTDAALRLTLSGVRGLAVTSLWLAAIEKQKRHDWNEVELIVDSLTRLQPRFVSPWIYQGWNLAFNVSVECDRARDKYYYISRGITLLCRGEEKNDPGQARPPQLWPANPEMRFEIATTYHRKIGQGDESKTFRCLFDLSCIPAVERAPDQFYAQGPHGKQINLERFKVFCENYPRFVRRLRERLTDYKQPEAIVQFLADNKDIPARIADRGQLKDEQRLAEFPILPPQDIRAPHAYADWRNEALGNNLEDFDVFVCMRAWHSYAQIPLPPPDKDDVGASDEQLKSKRPGLARLKYRLPRFTTIIFRHYPARAQAFVAEELQKDGWFDGSGWRITDWFDKLANKPSVIVGTGPKFDSAAAWNQAFEWYRRYGLENGIYLEPADMKKLKEDAASKGANSFEGKKLQVLEINRDRTRFEPFFQQTRVERTAEAVAARKAIFEVEKQKAGNPNIFNIYHAKVLPQWLDLLLRYQEFRQLPDIQEESYTLQAEYFAQLQRNNRESLANLVKELAYAATWHAWPMPSAIPHPADLQGLYKVKSSGRVLKELVEKSGIKVLPIRNVEGVYDQMFLLEGQAVEQVRDLEAVKPFAMGLARQAFWPPLADAAGPDFAFARYVVWPPPAGGSAANPEIGLGQQALWPPTKAFTSSDTVSAMAGAVAGAAWPQPTFLMLSSAEQRRILTRVTSQRRPPAGQGWITLISRDVIERTALDDYVDAAARKVKPAFGSLPASGNVGQAC